MKVKDTIMRMKYAGLLAGLLLSAPAWAQTASVPPRMSGYGTLAATTASALLSTMTVGPGSPAFPGSTLPMIYIYNSTNSAGVLYVCPLGGTCTSSVGIPIVAGGAWGFNGASQNMTVIAASTATVVAQW